MSSILYAASTFPPAARAFSGLALAIMVDRAGGGSAEAVDFWRYACAPVDPLPDLSELLAEFLRTAPSPGDTGEG